MTTVYNQSGNSEEKVKVENSIVNQKGIELAKKEVVSKIAAGSYKEIETTIGLSDPQRWDIANPVLFQVKTVVYTNDKITDTYFTPFGIRTLRFTPNNGLHLNDKRVQLKGRCQCRYQLRRLCPKEHKEFCRTRPEPSECLHLECRQ
ncbi:MAG: hypothetical protein M0Q53_01255 [Prolixibacteraceae bacterium]|nr:hypothetical protein [Prolixibacteraceae bacterium]